MTGRESHLVELVSPSGGLVGSTTVADAHRPPGQLHRAFSVLLVDPLGQVLLQRRAEVKTRFAGRWANACCGHPLPGVPVAGSATVRLREELGVTGVDLREVGVYTYRAADPDGGYVECEYDHVLLGRVGADLRCDPDPSEVSDTRWIAREALQRSLASEPHVYAPWLAGVLAVIPEGPPG